EYGPRTRREFCHALPDEDVETTCLTQNDYDYERLLIDAFPSDKTTRRQVSAALGKYFDSSYQSSYGTVDLYAVTRGPTTYASFYYNDQEILLKIVYEDW
ncbi:MAG: hypothetical protein JXB38_10815, partial [Anaerolineales bacterium]|nr:hypothetical protein [Anaerolineales bacterium]